MGPHVEEKPAARGGRIEAPGEGTLATGEPIEYLDLHRGDGSRDPLGEEVTHVESAMLANGASAILVSGSGELARVVTRAIATTGADVELVEPVARPFDALRAALGEGAPR